MGHQLPIVDAPQVGQIQPVPPQVQPQPTQTPSGQAGGEPTSPEDLEQRKKGWRGFFDRLRTDKALQQMMFTMGTKLMQPLPPGQSSVGHFGKALEAGNVARAGVESAAAAGAVTTRELDIKQQQANTASAKSAKGSAPASEVQVLNLLANAKVKEAKARGETLTIESALLEAEKDRRTKDPLDYFASILPLIALIPDAAERAAMTQRVLESLAQLSKEGNVSGIAAPTAAGAEKRLKWNDNADKFTEK